MSPNLTRIGDKAKAHLTLVFTSLSHHMADIEHLRACYQLLEGNKAVGVAEVTKSMYAADLEAHLQDLSTRLKGRGPARCGPAPPARPASRPTTRPGSDVGAALLSLDLVPPAASQSRRLAGRGAVGCAGL